jgi:hypothetical protein
MPKSQTLKSKRNTQNSFKLVLPALVSLILILVGILKNGWFLWIGIILALFCVNRFFKQYPKLQKYEKTFIIVGVILYIVSLALYISLSIKNLHGS